ncbi:hypothetical protein M407DRAFT_86584, partial [Tulasnella calospora MUT 4182]
MASSTFADRPIKKLCLFDIDGTLIPPRERVSQKILDVLAQLRKKMAIGFVSGADLAYISKNFAVDGGRVVDRFDYSFAENGLTAYKMGKELPSESFIKIFGDTEYKKFVNFILHYLADIDIPVKRGTFVHFRNGMINVSPIGHNATIQEGKEFEAYDKIHQVRAKFMQKLKE